MRRIAARATYLVLAGLILGGIVHLVSMLALPSLAGQNADSRLAATVRRHAVTVLPAAGTEAGPLPFRDPATALAVCRFDLAEGPVRVAGPVPDGFMSAAFHLPTGGVFYALTDRSATRGTLDILVVTQEQLEDLQANDPEDEPVRELRIVAPQATGIVTLRALALEPSQMSEAEDALRKVRCGPEDKDEKALTP